MSYRAYVLLYRKIMQTRTVDLYFPLKNDNALSHPGMPQFFGGQEELQDKIDYEIVYREAAEESNNAFLLADSKGIVPVFSGTGFTYYISSDFIGDDKELGPIKNNEMKSLNKLSIKADELKTFNCGELLRRLGINSPSKDFPSSETETAFNEAFKFLNTLAFDNTANNKQ
ncbi:hypothetical protein FAM09_13910 [Niastella caeni]|uniref:Nudix hydrolase domain-containing protein n=1 Tax=Niastella caeni TaxID=2569763 RepID=A0A4S8I1L5_9BACT|nr:hypothetical protein [Niastella caeni]THU39592.1 hypothetical protein FAM09_13910 [Niastella caeni]